ncbi:uncharacterized protein LOC115337036 [Aquila chrysaetos chrysaetos]|uniref:uncharacterized protein LOC115337036 n=1 Tax=Aquila chrysaetos chrysaetos TaxID=223781 RepID=UPI001B7D3A57|nr:uncharacterized protein LOC115337036 [Aquila chrysaetos chrysaetos]
MKLEGHGVLCGDFTATVISQSEVSECTTHASGKQTCGEEREVTGLRLRLTSASAGALLQPQRSVGDNVLSTSSRVESREKGGMAGFTSEYFEISVRWLDAVGSAGPLSQAVAERQPPPGGSESSRCFPRPPRPRRLPPDGNAADAAGIPGDSQVAEPRGPLCRGQDVPMGPRRGNTRVGTGARPRSPLRCHRWRSRGRRRPNARKPKKDFVSCCECNVFDSIPAGENIFCDGGRWSWEGDRADPARAAAGRAQRGQTTRSRPRSSHQGAAIGSRAAAGTQWGPPMGLVRSGVRGTSAGRAAWGACGGRAAVEPFPGAARGAAGNRLGAPHPSRPNCSATSRTA